MRRNVVFVVLASGGAAGDGAVQLVSGYSGGRKRAGTVFGLLPQSISPQSDSHAGVDPMGAESGFGDRIWSDHGRLRWKAGQSTDHFVGYLWWSGFCDVFGTDGK